jgi:AraC-like DNA-binding protein
MTSSEDGIESIGEPLAIWIQRATECCIRLGPLHAPAPALQFKNLRRLFEEIPAAPDPLERERVNQFAFELAVKSGIALHDAFHLGTKSNCPFDPARLAVAIHDRQRDSASFAAHWLANFDRQFDLEHSLHRKASSLIGSRLADKLSLEEIAIELGVEQAYLSASFQNWYGVSIAAFQRQLRAAHALRLLAIDQMKVEAVIWAVGYGRSRKNFYRLLRATFGARPAELRLWSSEQVATFEATMSADRIPPRTVSDERGALADVPQRSNLGWGACLRAN